MTRLLVLVLALSVMSLLTWKSIHNRAEQPFHSAVKTLMLDKPSLQHTVLVYGGDRCPATQHALESLRMNHVPVRYVNIEQPAAEEAFHERYDGTDLADDTGHYVMPVIEFGGRVSMRPDPEDVVRQFNDAP